MRPRLDHATLRPMAGLRVSPRPSARSVARPRRHHRAGVPLLCASLCAACGQRDRPSEAAGASATPIELAVPDEGSAPAHGDGAGRRATSAPDRFPELADLPRARPLRVIALPARVDVPRFEVAGPLLFDDPATELRADLAVVASSQLGFAAIDWRTGKVAWTRPSGAHVAPPVLAGPEQVVLLGECARPPDTGAPLVGCARVVAPGGADRSDMAVTGPAELAAALRTPGRQQTWAIDEHRVAWRRGDQVATVALATGTASAGAPPPAPLVVEHGGAAIAVHLDDDGHLRSARVRGKPPAWQARGTFAAILGVIPGGEHETPMLRLARPSTVRSVGASSFGTSFDVLDVDALTATGGAAATPAPGVQLLASASTDRAAAALVVRLDRSLRRDYVIAYTRTARVAWVYPLPEVVRPDAVGVAVAPDGVLVFHDGDTLTVLPAIE